MKLAVLVLACACTQPRAPAPIAHTGTAQPTSPFAALGLHVPPEQGAWTPDPALPPALVDATRTLLATGLADPRGLEYRDVGLVVGDATVHTHAWTFDGDRHAVAWNGIVYRVARRGASADVHRDAGAVALLNGKLSWQEREAVAVEPLTRLRVVMLALAGEAAAAARLWSALPAWDAPFARTWVYALFDHAIGLRGAGDHAAAAMYARAAALARGKSTDIWVKDLELDRFVADEGRRAKASHVALSAAPQLDELIAHLDEAVLISQGFMEWSDRTYIPGLTAIGKPAIDRLVEVIASDPRLTLGVAEGNEHLDVLGIEIAAEQVVSDVLGKRFGLTSTRAEAAAEIEAYWAKWRDVTTEERWYLTLADDHADPHDQVMAALSIANRMPQVLRAHAPPAVSTLLARRMATVSINDACYLADGFHRWDPGPANPAIAQLAARVMADPQPDGHCLSNLAEMRDAAGDPAGVDEYARWIARTTPDPQWQSTLMFESLVKFAARPSIAQAIAQMFRPGSPWVPLVDPASGRDLSDLFGTTLIATAPLNRQALVELADTRELGKLEMIGSDRYLVKLAHGGGVESVIDTSQPFVPPLGTKFPIRVCDWVADHISGHNPRFQLYWDRARRDAAIATTVAWVKAQLRP